MRCVNARLRRSAVAVDMLLSHEHLTLQEANVLTSAPEHLKKHPALGFSDCLVLGRST